MELTVSQHAPTEMWISYGFPTVKLWDYLTSSDQTRSFLHQSTLSQHTPTCLVSSDADRPSFTSHAACATRGPALSLLAVSCYRVQVLALYHSKLMRNMINLHPVELFVHTDVCFKHHSKVDSRKLLLISLCLCLQEVELKTTNYDQKMQMFSPLSTWAQTAVTFCLWVWKCCNYTLTSQYLMLPSTGHEGRAHANLHVAEGITRCQWKQ